MKHACILLGKYREALRGQPAHLFQREGGDALAHPASVRHDPDAEFLDQLVLLLRVATLAAREEVFCAVATASLLRNNVVDRACHAVHHIAAVGAASITLIQVKAHLEMRGPEITRDIGLLGGLDRVKALEGHAITCDERRANFLASDFFLASCWLMIASFSNVKSSLPILAAAVTRSGQYSDGMLLRLFISDTVEGPTFNTLAMFTFDANSSKTLWMLVICVFLAMTRSQHYSCRVVNMTRVAKRNKF